MSEMDYKVVFEKTAKSLALSDKAMRECQLLLCPQQEWGDCAKDIKDGEKCECGFEDGPFANAVPKNREADRLRARVADLEAAWTKENNVAGKFEGELQVAEARVAELESARRYDATVVSSKDDTIDALEARVAELEAKMQSIHRITSPGSRTLDEMIRDMGYANDVSRIVLAKERAA